MVEDSPEKTPGATLAQPAAGGRWLVVSNRLPFRVSREESGESSSPTPTLKVSRSSGGLVTALTAARPDDVECVWIGCAPENLSVEEWPEAKAQLAAMGDQWSYVPVFLEPELYGRYYNGFCNDVLWPLLHYETERARFSEGAWEAYVEANRRIAEAIARSWRPGDLIWLHDYHLFMAPSEIRRLLPDARVGFFLHVPFPSSETFRQLPARDPILRSLLQADLIGFHDYSYLYHFCRSAMRVVGLESGVESAFLSIRNGNHVTRLGVFPVAIDTARVEERARSSDVRAESKALPSESFRFLGIDRLDYIKGLDLKLLAFRSLLSKFPETRGRATLLQVAIPTREGAPEFARLAADTARLVGEINGEFSAPSWTPIQYIHNSVCEDQLLALYRSSDALLVTSKRDGMNLVALEYVASQSPRHPGVVLLSEFAGALSILSHAVVLNPWDVEDTARKMREAMDMSPAEKERRMSTMQKHLRAYTARDWAEQFLGRLQDASTSEAGAPRAIDATDAIADEIAARVCADLPERIALMLDYDGTLVPIENAPDLAVLHAEDRDRLRAFARYDWLDALIVSGRDSKFLDAQFGSLARASGLHLAAEHGARYFDPETGKWRRRVHRSCQDWYSAALRIMSDYAARVPGSLLERKQYSIAWHYRRAPAEYGAYQARKLAEELELGLANMPAALVRGKMVIEVRAVEADKGTFANWFLESRAGRAFALAFGDDRTDEDLFGALGPKGISFKVGPGASRATYALKRQESVIPFVGLLLAAIDRRLVRVSSDRPRESPLLTWLQ